MASIFRQLCGVYEGTGISKVKICMVKILFTLSLVQQLVHILNHQLCSSLNRLLFIQHSLVLPVFQMQLYLIKTFQWLQLLS